MISLKSLSLGLVVGVFCAAGLSTVAGAHRRSYHHHHAPLCHSRMEGRATGQGLFGLGTENARAAAVSDWQAKAAARWGEPYAYFDKSRGARWDCKKNAILKAKCVVTALPCR